MDPREQPTRLPSWAQISELLGSGNQAQVVIPGTPEIQLIVGASGEELGIFVGQIINDENIPALTALDIIPRTLNGFDGSYIFTRTNSIFRAFYDLICNFADATQIDGSSPDAALTTTLSKFKTLISIETSLTEDQQIGLIGELLFLQDLSVTLGFPEALQSWHRIDNSEHDFDLGHLDVEVKSTRLESRVHRISSEYQLQESLHRPLYLVSFQFTNADSGSGHSVESLVDEIRSQFATNDDVSLINFEKRLASVGWRSEKSKLCKVRVRHRSSPRLIQIDNGFPRLTRDSIQVDPLIDYSRIQNVSYLCDVSGLGSDMTLAEIGKLVHQ